MVVVLVMHKMSRLNLLELKAIRDFERSHEKSKWASLMTTTVVLNYCSMLRWLMVRLKFLYRSKHYWVIDLAMICSRR